MKVGTFVGKGTISLTDDEIKIVMDRVVPYFNNWFKDLPIKFKMDVKTSLSYDKERIINIAFIVLGEHTFIDTHRTKFVPTYISISLRKQKGYDENVYGRFYEWKDGFVAPCHMTSYSGEIDLKGYERRYKCRNILHTDLIKCEYQFGTELEDIHFEERLNKIYNYLKLSHKINEKLPIKC